MFKSIFSKYFTLTAVLLLVAIVVLGALQLFFFNSYWMRDKEETLSENAEQIAYHAANLVVQDSNDTSVYYLSVRSVQPLVNLMAGGLETQILITDTTGSLLVTSRDASVSQTALPQTVIDQINDSYFAVGTMDDFFETKQYAAATPIVVPGNVCVGYVIVAMPADGLMRYMQANLRTYLISALVVLLIFSVVIYLVTYRMVKPLREMAAATRRFAEGDFSVRIRVRGRDEVAELGEALNNMAISLSATENMSRSFVANISHELKTPMTTIGGFVDGILDGTIPLEKQNYYLQIVSDEVKRLSRLVKSMLNLSRIDNGSLKINPVTFDLTDAICSAILSFEPRIVEKHVDVQGLAECERVNVTGDYDLIGQVVYNLLDNAVKFVNENGTITVGITRQEHRIYCSIRNTGVGLSPEEMPRVFERFYKTDRSRSLDKTGVGLGLYIVKMIINLHHGEIFVRSLQNEYCEFIFWLPDGSAPPDHTARRSIGGKSQKG
ncbi:MAG: HAMP domain-containing histidine kinase [Clostridia bacterium]|nr:HAMP domain-containing histidine kinase [Clostridia bacterium]